MIRKVERLLSSPNFGVLLNEGSFLMSRFQKPVCPIVEEPPEPVPDCGALQDENAGVDTLYN
jgi:hypothetical protein